VRLSNQNDELQTEIERLRKIVDKNASEIVEIIQELKQLKEQSEEMTFDNVVLGQ
jgi:acetyl-CoA carboxylase alpha subunit